MSIGDEWGPRLARAVSPDEEELAPIYVDAFVEGGQARRDLFAPGVRESGGFDSGDSFSILTPVLYALSIAAPLLNGFLSSPQIAALSSMANSGANVLRLFGYGKRSTNDDEATVCAMEQTARETTGAADRAMTPTPDQQETMRKVIECIETELHRRGFSEEESSVITLGVVRELLREPEESVRFVSKLEQATE